ncbi:CASP-like protein 4D1 [Trifolium pratense]|uniref:CASP-like protein 4D1 n=1 Tax=Trifolium pratense TaxID=57577 RepID=UPI001E6944C5|nr:CASP-like protein 4D1 [Trifolium pratense]
MIRNDQSMNVYNQLFDQRPQPSSSIVSRTVILLLRVLTFVFLLIALILIVSTTANEDPDYDEFEIKLKDVHAFRYMIWTIAIGFMVLSVCTLVSGNRVLNGDGGYKFDFYGDKIISYLLLSGSAAGFGASKDLDRFYKEELEHPLNSFFRQANASASLLLFGFIATAMAAIFTSFALPKKAK